MAQGLLAESFAVLSLRDGRLRELGVMSSQRSLPPRKQGLYDPQFEKDSCGVGFVVNVDGKRSNQIVHQALEVLTNLSHRGACGCDPESGDGAGIMTAMVIARAARP